ncbi:hypothetical protein C9439_08260 [archaeon SCG-AAA382B04]|nr:hypothetical protein C9439_08260 [archaeon SCG-AAA382B04]
MGEVAPLLHLTIKKGKGVRVSPPLKEGVYAAPLQTYKEIKKLVKKHMKILLIHPPAEEDLLFKKIIGLTPQPIGLGYVAAAVENKGHSVELLDIPAQNISKKELIISKKELIKKIRKFDPDVIGVYLATYRCQKGLKILEIAKKYSNNAKTVCGGPHSTVTAEDLVKNQSVDYVVSGEAEQTFPELLETIDKNKNKYDVNGIVFCEDNEAVSTDPPKKIEDLDDLPTPARHHFDMEKYTLMNHLEIASIVSSRGCPFDCNYCSVPAIFGTECRLRSAEDIVNEIEEVNKKYGPDLFMFMDDNFDYSIDRLWKICDLLEERDLDILWGCCSSGINSNNPGLLKRMDETGCKVLSYNLESGSKKSLEVMDPGISYESTKKDLELAGDLGLIRILNIIIGMPGETRDDIIESIQFAKEVNPEFPLFFLPTPYPGTKFYKTAKRQGMIKEGDWKKYTSYNPIIENESLSQEELRELLERGYKECYLNPASVKNKFKMMINRLTDGSIGLRDTPPITFDSLNSMNYIRKL